MMKKLYIISILIIFILANGCVTEFEPEITESEHLLVVEGLITDQHEASRVKLSSSTVLGESLTPVPVSGAHVRIQNDLGESHILAEKEPGSYYTNPDSFRVIPGRKYALFLDTPMGNYASDYCELVGVPPVDSVYYEKEFIKYNPAGGIVEGCQIYLDAYDPSGKTRYFRWDYTETWLFRLPYNVPNNACWITLRSGKILLANTAYLTESKISRFPLTKIGTETDDRLLEKYSIMIDQFSLNEDEYRYWEKIGKIAQESGGLYDVTPMTIEGNIHPLDDPEGKVLGYFSVSSVSSGRLFIDDIFQGYKNLYASCPYATVPKNWTIPYLGTQYWVIIVNEDEQTKTYTDQIRCADCTTRGTTEKPDFWPDFK